jgi:uncharacterized protein (DUF1800 family)
MSMSSGSDRTLMGGCPRRLIALLGMLAILTGGGCAATRPAGLPAGSRSAGTALSQQDIQWLERIGYGVTTQELATYRQLGRERFLEEQLRAQPGGLPAALQARVQAQDSAYDVTHAVATLLARRRALQTMPDVSARQEALRAMFMQGNQVAAAAASSELLQAVYDPAQLREQMVWFWLNHFSVSQNKAGLRWLVGDYAEHAIRPNALGHFRDLVMATLEHPAMLQYLDNAQNRVGHINENYAREFMELHTLGVSAGYTQQDVQTLARVFTGVGIYTGRTPRLPPRWRADYVQRGGFEFNPMRHDFGPKTLLGHRLRGQGFPEVENAVALIVRQPACAHFISLQLARYFVADDPPEALVNEMARTFRATDGDIAAVLRTLFTSPQLTASLGHSFKDPMRYVISSVRVAYDGDTRLITNARPVLGWLYALGEAPFGRQTPDGYPLEAVSWSSPGQMSRRFERARALASGAAPLFADPAEVAAAAAAGPGGAVTGRGPASGSVTSLQPAAFRPAGQPPQLDGELYHQAIEPFLAPATRDALAHARSAREWNFFLLASPELNYE